MNAKWLRSFLLFAEDINFSHTARRLGVSQPAVHEQIGKLEEQIGAPLYYKMGHRLQLTLEGERLAVFGRALAERTVALNRQLCGDPAVESIIFAADADTLQWLVRPAIGRFLATDAFKEADGYSAEVRGFETTAQYQQLADNARQALDQPGVFPSWWVRGRFLPSNQA